jgi:hypothetical protein
MFLLVSHGPFVVEAEPSAVFFDSGREFRPASFQVDIVDPQEEPSMVRFGKVSIE